MIGHDEIIRILRGERVKFYLVDGKVILSNNSFYPYDNKLPVQCQFKGKEKLPCNYAFTSGNRSIIIRISSNEILKAKGVGIPTGSSRPIYDNGQIYTYFLNKAYIGSGKLIWGFLSLEEARNELNWMRRAYKLKLSVTKPVGYGIYENVKTITFANRLELFDFLRARSIDNIIKIFRERARDIEAACLFVIQSSDIRVDEILYALLFPRINEIINVKECKEYLKWIGSSCGFNLKQHHNFNIVHGTIFKGPGLMTNSHLANHIVDFEGTWMTDYHMAYEVGGEEGERVKMEEYYCLWYVMNPLPAAIRILMSRRRKTVFNLVEMPMEIEPYPAFQTWEDVMRRFGEIFRPENVYEEFTEALIDGIEYGYNREKIFEVESELKREMLIKLAIIKRELWRMYNLPEGMQRGVEVVNSLMKLRRIDDDKIRMHMKNIEKSWEKLL